MADEDLDDVAERLYALAPEEFTAARDAAAKAARDRDARAAVKALRRPTVSAWLVNLLARTQPDLLQQLLELGPELAEAQSAGQGDALRTLGQQRRQLVAAVTGAAVDLAGRSVTPQVRAEVEQTLEAALADPGAADALRSGRLVRPLSYAGFGDVDLDGAVARPATGSTRSVPRTTRTKQPDGGALEQQALDAAAALDDAVRACESAVRRRDEAGRRRGEAAGAAQAAADEVQQLERQLAEARDGEAAARAAEAAADEDARAAESDAETAARAVARAQEAAEQARAALDSARRG